MNMKNISILICTLLMTSAITISTNADDEVYLIEKIESVESLAAARILRSTTAVMFPGRLSAVREHEIRRYIRKWRMQKWGRGSVFAWPPY